DALAARTQTLLWRFWTCFGLARLAWARGEVETAFDELDRAVASAGRTGAAQPVRDLRAHHARLSLAPGRTALARRWFASVGLGPYLPATYERQTAQLTFVRLLLAEDRPALALKLLAAVADLAAAQGRTGDLVEVAVLQALAQKGVGDHAAALAALDRA